MCRKLQAKYRKKLNFKKCMTKVRSSVDFAMKRRLKRRPGGKKKIDLKAAPWVDSELKENIKLRSKLSKAWRHARKRKEPEEVLDKYKDEYFLQKSRTAILTGDKKSEWEESKITETWGGGKTFWKMIKELLGKDKENSEDAYIYTEDGEKKEINECKEEFITNWTQQVYQKLERADFTFWYDETNGQKQEMIKK